MELTAPSPTPDRWDELCAEEVAIAASAGPSPQAGRWVLTDPGPVLAATLAGVDVNALDDDDCVVYAQAVQRQQAWTDHLLHTASARFAALRPGPESQREFTPGHDSRVDLGGPTGPVQTPTTASYFAAAEWGLALRMTSGVARRLLADSLDLTHRLPGVAAYLRIGLCHTWRARLVADATRDLAPLTVYAVEDEILPILSTLTRRRLQHVIDRIVARLEPDRLADKAQQAKPDRRVFIRPTTDEHADVFATLEATAALRLDRRLDTLAKLLGLIQRHHTKAGTRTDTAAPFGPKETWDQRRARALGLLAEPATVAALIRAVRAITHPGAHTSDTDDTNDAGNAERADADAGVDDGDGIDDQTLATLQAEADTAAAALAPIRLYLHLRADGTIDLEGHGVLSHPTARDLLSGAHVRLTPVIDLNTRLVSPGYVPSAELREQTILINEHCWFPYCDRPARDADFEHTIPWPRGPTATGNTGSACRYHHRVKTHGDFQLAQPFPGIYLWRTPTGDIHIVHHHGTRTLR